MSRIMPLMCLLVRPDHYVNIDPIAYWLIPRSRALALLARRLGRIGFRTSYRIKMAFPLVGWGQQTDLCIKNITMSFVFTPVKSE